MKNQIQEQIGVLTPSHKEWYRHLANCIEHEICPRCGEHIVLQEEHRLGTATKVFYFECSCCRWRNA